MRSGPISSSGPNTLVSTAAYDIPDDILFTLGDDSDIAMLLRSSTYTADNALTGVLIGTPDTSGLAADSLIIANKTEDGDMLFAINDGGTSRQFLFMDGDTGLLNLGSPATSSHSLATGDVVFGDAVEINGVLYADGATTAIEIGSCTTGISIPSASNVTTGISILDTGCTDAITIGVKDTGDLIRTSAKPRSMEIFSKIDVSENITTTLRGLWSRFRVDAGTQVGSSGGWGEGMDAIEASIKFFGGATTDIYCWQTAGLWAMLECDGQASVNFKTGSHPCALFAHIELANNTTIESGSAAAAVVAFSNSAASGVTTTGTYDGVLIDKESGKLNFDAGLRVTDSVADVGIDVGTCATGIDFTGTYTGNVIDFSNATISPTGGDGPCLIRAGTYDSPIDLSTDIDQSGMIRLYQTTSGTTTNYDRGVFVCLKTTGTKNVMPIAGLAEIGVQSDAGPTNVHAAEFICNMNTSTSAIGASGTGAAGMAAIWAKIGSTLGSATNASSRIAAIWLDTTMSGTVSGESYVAWITTSTDMDAIFGIHSATGTGVATNLFYFDSSCEDQLPVSNTTLKVLLDTTQYYLPLSTTNDAFTWAYPIVSSMGVTGSVRAVDITTTTSETSGNCIALEVEHTRDTDSVSGRDWGIKSTMKVDNNAKFPGGVNAIYGSLELGSGGAHGRAAGVQGELVMPDAQLTRGTFSCLHADLTCSADTNWGSAGPLSVLSFVVGGTKTFFEANAYLLELTGVTEGNGNMCDNGATPTADGGIRVLINGAERWLLYANDPD